MTKRLYTTLLLLASLALGACTCQKTSGSSNGDVPDAAVEKDGAPDRPDACIPDAAKDPDSGRPQGTQYGFCGEPFFKLPMDGAVEESSYVRIWGESIAYKKRNPGPYSAHGYYFDLTSCTEYPVDPERKDDFGPLSIHDRNLTYVDCRYSAYTPEYHGCDLFLLDLETWQEERLTDDPYGKSDVRFNGRFLVYLEKVNLDVMSPSKLMLWDTVTGERWELAAASSMPGYFALSERYAVWSAYTQDPLSVGRDVFYYDLDTNLTIHIDSTYERYQESVSAWGNYIAWTSSDVYTTPPYHLTLYDIQTKEETALAENDRTFCYGTIHENLVAWTTGKYREDQDPSVWPADLEIYDINTGVFRRVTTRPSRLRQVMVFFPYLVIVDVLGQERNMDDYYVAHLAKLGITDGEARVIEGDGVLEPPRE